VVECLPSKYEAPITKKKLVTKNVFQMNSYTEVWYTEPITAEPHGLKGVGVVRRNFPLKREFQEAG
jgi:hypothetical protein